MHPNLYNDAPVFVFELSACRVVLVSHLSAPGGVVIQNESLRRKEWNGKRGAGGGGKRDKNCKKQPPEFSNKVALLATVVWYFVIEHA